MSRISSGAFDELIDDALLPPRNWAPRSSSDSPGSGIVERVEHLGVLESCCRLLLTESGRTASLNVKRRGILLVGAALDGIFVFEAIVCAKGG